MIAPEEYFERIGYPIPDQPTLSHLKKLHRAHVTSIPFENLDIHYPQPIVLEPKRFFDKLVTRQRGGFCYEQNGLLYEVLQQLGYRVWLISASVYQVDENEFGPAAAHVAIIAELNGQHWLVDVGFGSSFPEPLLLEKDQPQEQDGIIYLVKSADDQNFVLDRSYDGGQYYTPMYRFDLTPYPLGHFRKMCYFHQTSEKSTLYRKKLISIAQSGGRVTLTDHQLIITEGKDKKKTDVKGETDFRENLYQHFGFQIMNDKVENAAKK